MGAAEECYAQLGTVLQRLNTDTRLYHALIDSIEMDEAEAWSEEQKRMAHLLRVDFERCAHALKPLSTP